MKDKHVAPHQQPAEDEKETISHRLRALEKRMEKNEDLAARALATAQSAEAKIGE